MFNPIATYRLQFHKGFSFQDFRKCIPYFKELGVATIYASPIFKAIPGSTHGYDCTNPLALNEEIGTLDELREISRELKEQGIAWIQDIVPNHMSYHPDNAWLMDVLEKGRASEFASFFDISWDTPGAEKLMAPFIAKPLEDAVNDGDLKIVPVNGKWMCDYFGSHYPLSKESINNFIEKDIDINNDKKKLLQLLKAQHYRLCFYQETDATINYRRFFIVNSLICVNIQDEKVFNHHHALLKQLSEEGLFQGFRIDHIDGLHDPAAYVERLRNLVGDESYIVAEKILEPGETLPRWVLQGTTGYDFMSDINNLFTNRKARKSLTDYYQSLTGNYLSIQEQIHKKKTYILANHMKGELENLYRLFLRLNLVDKHLLASLPTGDLKSALGQFLVQCPVYRFYGTAFPLNGDEEAAVRQMLQHLRKSGESKPAVTIIENVFLVHPHQGDADRNERTAQFYKRCMQFSGPLMAKGVEDTLMYTYNRFIGHNEVGDSPEAFGVKTGKFHQDMIVRRQQWPLSMNATSTHDTKRGEDVQARLSVLTDISEDWLAKVEEWRQLNAGLKKDSAPDNNDEYLIYQALIGHYDFTEEEGFGDRLQQYLEKALREAKTHSGWETPNDKYESATKDFAVALLNKEQPFWNSFSNFARQIADAAVINSLTQVLLKFTLPGVPDTYQGCELWEYSFVDPDNRRLIDFERRKDLLKKLTSQPADLFQWLWNSKEEGAIKFWLVKELFHLRKTEAALFTEGEYIPLETSGTYQDSIFAFARKQGTNIYIFAVPLHSASLCKEQGTAFFQLDWQDTAITLPKGVRNPYDVLHKAKLPKQNLVMVKNLFTGFPVAILKSGEAAKERGAGILAHISSLPSAFGIGDLGPGAKAFAGFLHRSGQKYWQLLPVNPTDGGQGYSPYSALSSKAGWPLFISPEGLVDDGLLKPDDIAAAQLPNESRINYELAEAIKTPLLEKAFENFLAGDESAMDRAFRLFCEKEKGWLDDFALYIFLKNQQGGLPWYEWPPELKKRDTGSLYLVQEKNSKALQKIKWLQFIFTRQWNELKTYCNSHEIQLIGDMPFYVSYDSADVWASQELFALNENSERTSVAGVPPDRFSADGQLWGMPTFNWGRMKEDGYTWWIQRLHKNIELFDSTRLDHFRAFAAYWEVPAEAKTAQTGHWVEGPGLDFFNVLQKEFGELPFVAEDLGDIDDAVLALRDAFHLPGMKVLQFAFDGDLSKSDYIPHNYTKNCLVYTGTHDNNTTVGWWRTEAVYHLKEKIESYVGLEVNEHNVHIVLSRLAYASVADVVILPVQDILGLNETARMNVPSSAANNWNWRLLPWQLTTDHEKGLAFWVQLYNR